MVPFFNFRAIKSGSLSEYSDESAIENKEHTNQILTGFVSTGL